MDKKQKTKRSPNYTLEEKNNLLSIVSKYQNVIDCKRTGAYFVQQKKAAWKSVVMEYNSICTTGNRREDMLKHFYNNIKHRARKDSAIKNKKRYSEQLSLQTTNEDFFTQPSTSSQDEQTVVVEEANNESIIINENLLKDLKKKCADEQKNIKKTGGGSFTPTITESEYQILSVLDNQIHPDVNPYDEAAEYFGENVEENSKKEQVHKTNPSIHRKKKQKIRRITLSKMHSAEMLKRIYFKKKIELACYQKKTEMQRFRYEKKKYDIEIEILKIQREKAKNN